MPETPEGERRTPSPRRKQDAWDAWAPRIRSMALFVLGLFGAADQLFRREEPSYAALALIATLVGVPIFAGLDEKRNNGGG